MRDNTLDWIRVCAMFGILLDHYLCQYNISILQNFGTQLGGFCVSIFFAVSAYLFGEKWRNSGFTGFSPLIFLKSRFVRIFIPLWLMILFTVPFELYLTNRFEISTILCNVVGLGWASPFGISGHFWFITMLIILYLFFLICSYANLNKVKLHWWFLLFLIIVFVYYVGQNNLNTYSKAGPPMFVFMGVLLFSKGDLIIKIVKSKIYIWSAVAIVLTILSLYIYQLGWHDSHKAIAVLSFILSGTISFLVLFSIVRVTKENKYIKWLSGISFEVYLTHQPLIHLCWFLFPDKTSASILWLFYTVVCSVVLKKVSTYCTSKLGI